MNKKSGLKSEIKRKLVTGTLETVIGLGILAFSLATGASLYLYAGGLFAASGAFTLAICGLRAFTDKKMAEREARAEEKRNGKIADNSKERVAEATKQAEQTQEQTQESSQEHEQPKPNQEAQPQESTQDSNDAGMEM